MEQSNDDRILKAKNVLQTYEDFSRMETHITARNLRKAFFYLTNGEDEDWEAIKAGEHPELADLVSILNGPLGKDCSVAEQSDEPSSSVDATSKACKGSAEAQSLTEEKSAGDSQVEEGEPVKTKKCKIMKKNLKELTIRICRCLPPKYQAASDKGGSGMQTESSQDDKETQDASAQHETDENANSKDENEYESFPMETSQDEVVEPSVDEDESTQPTISGVDELVQVASDVIKDLTSANQKFQEVVKDPLDESTDETDNRVNERIQKSEVKGVWIASQQNAEMVEWSSDDESVESSKNDRWKKKKKRAAWSEDEMDWIRMGVRKFGTGDWATIRDYFPFRDTHRNSVAIKDKYRNMLRNGQIIDK